MDELNFDDTDYAQCEKELQTVNDLIDINVQIIEHTLDSDFYAIPRSRNTVSNYNYTKESHKFRVKKRKANKEALKQLNKQGDHNEY